MSQEKQTKLSVSRKEVKYLLSLHGPFIFIRCP